MSEYALIIALIAVVLIGSLVIFSDDMSALVADTADEMVTTSLEAAVLSSAPQWVQDGFQDIVARMQAYYNEKGHWVWGNRAKKWASLGLNMSDMKVPLDGLQWELRNNKIGLTNIKGDNIDIFVTDMNGNQIKIKDGRRIWCDPVTGKFYAKSIAPGNEIDINSLTIVEND